MEGNRDEALRCIDIGKRAYYEGDLNKALRFFKKSYKMYPNETAKHWIEKVENGGSHSPKPSDNFTKKPRENNPEPEKPATKKQIEEIQRIISCKGNYYSVLQVDRKATTKEIEKRYKKVCLYGIVKIEVNFAFFS